MSIKSDKWIRRMAASHRMIEPFEPGQVREVNGHKIVSYGTSSYGYDIRCSNEFKIFTNINSTIVDPKAFDAGSFVDFRGDVCIIPPNSFALARTVEYFRIPRNVLTICLGKSTYATMRHHRKRNATRAGVGRPRHARVLQHHAAARQDLRQRGRRAGDLLRVRRSLRNLVQGPRRQVPGTAGRDAAQDLTALSAARETRCMQTITTIEDLRVLAQQRVPRMFYDYADSGLVDRAHVSRQRERLRQDPAAPARRGEHGRPHHGDEDDRRRRADARRHRPHGHDGHAARRRRDPRREGGRGVRHSVHAVHDEHLLDRGHRRQHHGAVLVPALRDARPRVRRAAHRPRQGRELRRAGAHARPAGAGPAAQGPEERPVRAAQAHGARTSST